MSSSQHGGLPTVASVSSPSVTDNTSSSNGGAMGSYKPPLAEGADGGGGTSDSGIISTTTNNPSGFSFFVGLSFCVNMAMGTGFLTLPWAFAKAGLVLSAAVVAFTAFLGNLSKDFLLETMARAEAMAPREGAVSGLTDDGNQGSDGKSKSLDDEENDLTVPLINLLDDPRDSLPAVGTRKYDTVQLCEQFLGTKGKVAYALSLSIFGYGSLWAYSSVFASSLSSVVPLGSLGDYNSYFVYLVLFACFVVPLTCLELHEQITVQVSLSVCRIIMVVLMIYTTMTAFNATQPVFGDQCGAATTGLYNFKGLYVILPISMYCQIYHHAVPSLSHPVADKRQLGTMFAATFFICGCFYILIGGTVGWYFGVDGNPASHVEWKDYHGNAGMPHWVVLIIKHYMVLFPALNVSSAFPLNGITVGNNLMATYYGDKTHIAEKEKGTRLIFRLLAAIPPLIGAGIVRDLGSITNYTGIVAFLICFVFPSLLQWKSKEAFARFTGETDGQTAYSTPFTNTWASTWATLALGVSFVIYVLTYNIISSL